MDYYSVGKPNPDPPVASHNRSRLLQQPASSRTTQQCDQHPGEVFFVPDQWGHAVLNLKDSVAVAYEFHE